MMREPGAWAIRLTASAEADIASLLRQLAAEAGTAPAHVCADAICFALKDLCDGPATSGAHARDDIAPGLHTLHVARRGRKGHQFILFEVDDKDKDKAIVVLRVLGDALDLERYRVR